MRNIIRSKSVLPALVTVFLLTSCATGLAGNRSNPIDVRSAPTAEANSVSASPTGGNSDPLDNGGIAEFTWDDFVESQRSVSGLTSWPDADRIRYVNMEDWASAQAVCMTNRGFPAFVDTDGALTIHGVPGQKEAQAEATYICALQYPMDLRYAQAFSRTQLRAFYAYYRDELIPCLHGLGLESSPLPSEETFVEGTASGTSPWTPYDDLNLDTVDVNAMNQTCRPSPSEEVLYGR